MAKQTAYNLSPVTNDTQILIDSENTARNNLFISVSGDATESVFFRFISDDTDAVTSAANEHDFELPAGGSIFLTNNNSPFNINRKLKINTAGTVTSIKASWEE